ncbi:MAG TPA: hypothetical protein VIX73_24505, partial [Kofleriaceae bacterium]
MVDPEVRALGSPDHNIAAHRQRVHPRRCSAEHQQVSPLARRLTIVASCHLFRGCFTRTGRTRHVLHPCTMVRIVRARCKTTVLTDGIIRRSRSPLTHGNAVASRPQRGAPQRLLGRRLGPETR